MDLANRLTELRKNAGLTQAQLAGKINYSDKAISRWERGESLPDIVALLSLSKFYGVSLDSLTGESGVRPAAENGRDFPPPQESRPPAPYPGYAPPQAVNGGFIPQNNYDNSYNQSRTPAWYRIEAATRWANRAFVISIIALFLFEAGAILGAIAVGIGVNSYKTLKSAGVSFAKAKKAIIIGGVAILLGMAIMALIIAFVII